LWDFTLHSYDDWWTHWLWNLYAGNPIDTYWH
jgi:hypothetical protein